MAHTHEFNCIVCGERFDDERTLQHHNTDQHTTKQAIHVRAQAEPTGTERSRQKTDEKQPRAETRDGSPTPRYGSAGGGGAEFEPGPEKS